MIWSNETIDRMVIRAEIVIFEGKSYRLKGRIELPEFRVTKTARKEEAKI